MWGTTAEPNVDTVNSLTSPAVFSECAPELLQDVAAIGRGSGKRARSPRNSELTVYIDSKSTNGAEWNCKNCSGARRAPIDLRARGSRPRLKTRGLLP